MRILYILFAVLFFLPTSQQAQRRKKNTDFILLKDSLFHNFKWRNIGPFRGGRSVAVSGVVSDPYTYYMGSTGGGLWKTTDQGLNWENISDGFFKTGTVGAIGISDSNPNIIYVGMGEHAARGVMTSMGDGMYKSTDAGKTWTHIGLDKTRHISDVIVHPVNPDIVFVAAQGAQYGDSEDRGIFRSQDGGKHWEKVLYLNGKTGASGLTLDMNNPLILYAAMWEHRRYPWTMSSGGPHSGIYKSTDGGQSWDQMREGLPEVFGKSGISVSRANSEIVYAVIEAEGEKGGIYKSVDAGKKWTQVNKDRINIARSWYYMEIFADPVNADIVYVLNAPMTKSIDGGKTFTQVPTPHSDNHDLWIHPNNNQLMINANDGGANISANGGKSWSTQQNQPTAQFYRVITDNRFPYHVYGGQQDNSAIGIASRTNDRGIDWKDWYSVAGCESAYLAFDPDHPEYIFGGCYQGIIEKWIRSTRDAKPIMEYPELSLGSTPEDLKYRFNWNAPILSAPQDRNTIYHAGNVVFRSTDQGQSWDIISPDLTRNEKEKQGPGGIPFTNEAAGGENYNTLMYLATSPHQKEVLWAGSDDGLIHITRDSGESWQNITPGDMPQGIVNSIEVSPHHPGTAYAVLMRYKFMDLSSYVYKTSDYGSHWERLPLTLENPHSFVRVIREDPTRKGLLYAGTETGLHISLDDGQHWQSFQLNLPVVPINDLTFQGNDLIAATAGRAFWILDNLKPLQQYQGSGSDLVLITPTDTPLFVGGYSQKPVPGLGQNPESGVFFDYVLGKKPDSVDLFLEISKSGNVIRTYSSKKPEEFKSWPGGPAKPEVLPTEPGHNRFVWDFRKEHLPAIDQVFVFGDYSGSRVGPGQYTVKLKLGDHMEEATFNILPNPNTTVTQETWEEQQKMLDAIESVIRTIHTSVNEMRSVKKQLQHYEALLSGSTKAKPLLEKGRDLITRIDRWEENLIQPKQKTFQDVINYNNQLNAQFMYLKDYVDVTEPVLTKGAHERFQDLNTHWQSFLQEYKKIVQTEMEEYNTLYKSLDLPILIMD